MGCLMEQVLWIGVRRNGRYVKFALKCQLEVPCPIEAYCVHLSVRKGGFG